MLGTIEGSAGGLTFSSQNGLNVLKPKVGRNNSSSPAQQNTRARFKLLTDLFKRMGPAVRTGLLKQGGLSGYNRFVQQNFFNTEATPENVASIDYSKIVVSGGSVEPLAGVQAALNAATGVVTVSFADNSNGGLALDTDRVKVLLVDKTTGRAVGPDDDDATRADGSVDIEAAGQAAADLVVLAFAYRADNSDASPTSRAQVV